MNFGCVRDIENQRERERLESWRAGRIVVVNGRLQRVEKRLWGYRASRLRVWWDKRWKLSASARGRTTTKSPTESLIKSPIDSPFNAGEHPSWDVCQLYYHHGWLSADFLVLGYVRTLPAASLSTFYMSLLVLDEIARIKGSHAIVAEVTNARISDRLLARWGWEQHCLQLAGRHFIKRFYGSYPDQPALWRAPPSCESSSGRVER